MGKKGGKSKPGELRVVRAPLPQWDLTSKRPSLLLAQLSACYMNPTARDKRIRHVPDPAYVAKLESVLDAQRVVGSDFLVFPEYSWPVAAVERALAGAERLRDGQCCVVPFEHMTVAEAMRLMSRLPIDARHRKDTEEDWAASNPPSVWESGIVNMCAVLVRANNRLFAYVQSKLRPALLEDGRHFGEHSFVRSSRVTVIRGNGLSVATLICFDFLARDSGGPVRLRQLLKSEPPEILLVPECNPSPLHPGYAAAIIDLTQAPWWSKTPRVIAFANVASGSVLPHLEGEGGFGFSRVFGPLAECPEIENGFAMRDGVVAGGRARNLDSIREPEQQLAVHGLRGCYVRPQETLMWISVALDSEQTDFTTGRIRTEVKISRFLSAPTPRWKPILASAGRSSPPSVTHAIPHDLVPDGGLIGADELMEAFRRALGTAPKPVWVHGSGGVGKSAIVANLLRELDRAHFQVYWLDLERVSSRPDAIAEALLLAFGNLEGLKKPAEIQWRLIRERLHGRPTIIVLDSYEKGAPDDGDVPALPAEIAACHEWPSRVVVTCRSLVDVGNVTALEILRLDQAAASSLTRRFAGPDVDQSQLERMVSIVSGSPLECIWGGGLLEAGGVDLAALPAGAGPEDLFSLCTSTLTATGHRVLRILCALPAPLTEADLATIADLSKLEVGRALDELRLRALVVVDEEAGAQVHRIRHPLVRQFGVRTPQTADAEELCAAWACRLIEKHGGDRRWREYGELSRRWANLRHVLRGLAGRSPDRFLAAWREVDYFLWCSARWTDRITLGRLAERAADQVGNTLLQAHAIYDSVAETEYHRNHRGQPALAAFDRAAALVANDSRREACIVAAMVEYYRSRVLRKDTNDLDAAAGAANRAIAMAQEISDPHTIGLALNARGNVAAKRGDHDAAVHDFDQAREYFDRTHDVEMLAIVARNAAKIHLERGEYDVAGEKLERALLELQQLELPAEEAEVALHHARALAGLGDGEAARAELDRVEATFSVCGAGLRDDEIKDARADIDRLCAPTKLAHAPKK